MRSLLTLLTRYRAEVLAAIALLAGWILITWWAAALTSWRAWPLSLGLLSCSLGGWRFLFTIARECPDFVLGLATFALERAR